MNRKLTLATAGFILASAATFSSTVPAAASVARGAATAQRCVSPVCGGQSLTSPGAVLPAANTAEASRYPRPNAAAQNDFVIKGNCTEDVMCKPVGSARIIAHEAEEARQKRPTEDLYGSFNFRH